jgi:predicted RNA-binding Zn-ribbon protein involved in translation (DUF1610 family)
VEDEEPGKDDRPPICPACGVTMGIVENDGGTRYVCLECGFSDRD